MPRREPLNEKILQALESREHKLAQLKNDTHYAYGRAIAAIKGVNRNITNPATQLKNVKNITPTIFDLIIKVCNGTEPVEASPPTRRQLQRAEQQVASRFERPPAPGTGGWAIIITLYRECSRPQGPSDLTKDRIITLSRNNLGINLEDNTRGFTGWGNVKNLENKGWVHRDALSRRFGGPGGGSYGGAKDRFSLTDLGKQLGAELSLQAGDGHHNSSRHPAQHDAAGSYGRAAAAAATGHHSDDDHDNPFQQLLSGPEFAAAAAAHRSSPAAAAAAAAFTGRGQRLGGAGDSSPLRAARASAAAAAAAAAGSRRTGPTQADRGGIFCEWEDDWGADPATAFGSTSPSAAANTGAAAAAAAATAAAAAAAAAAANRRRASAASARRAASEEAGSPAPRRQLLPRVKASERPLPLCPDDKGCAECDCLRDFMEGGSSGAAVLHMANLSKAKQQHVKQVVGWLAAPEGGGHQLSVNVGPGKALSVHRNAAGGAGGAAAAAAGAQRRQEPSAAAARAAGSTDVLGHLSKLLSQKQSSPQINNRRGTTASPAAALGGAAAAGRQRSGSLGDLPSDLFGTAAAAGPAGAAAAAWGTGAADLLGFAAGALSGSEEWLLDAEDLQQQAALLEAAAATRRQSQTQPAHRQQQQQPQQEQLQGEEGNELGVRGVGTSMGRQRRQQQQEEEVEEGADGLTPAMRAAAAAEARMRQQQLPNAAHTTAGRSAQQQQHERGAAGTTTRRQQQQGAAGAPVVIIADSQADEELLDAGPMDWEQHVHSQQQQAKRRKASAGTIPPAAAATAAAAAAGGTAAPCIVILEPQDFIPSAAAAAAAAAAPNAAAAACTAAAGGSSKGGGSGSDSATAAAAAAGSRKRRMPDAATPPPVVLLDSQDGDELDMPGCPGSLNPDGPGQNPNPAKRRRQSQQQQQQAGNARQDMGEAPSAAAAAARAGAGGAVEGEGARAAAGGGSLPSSMQPVCIELLDTQLEEFDLPGGTTDPFQPDTQQLQGVRGAVRAARRSQARAQANPARGAADNSTQQQLGRAAADAAAAAAEDAGGSVFGQLSGGFELKLVVDEKERLENPDPNRIYSSLRQEHLAKLSPAAVPSAVTVDVDRDSLPLGDYLWLVLPQGQQEARHTGRGAAAAGGSSDVDGEDEESAAAAERSRCLVAGAVVERKTIRDLVGRSAKRDHLRQLQRMHYVADVLPHQLLIVENMTLMAERYVAYGSLTGAGPGSSTVINDEPSLFDFIVKAAVSEYGGVQRVLLAPSTADSRAILLAVTQLLLYEQWQRRQQQQQQQVSTVAGERGRRQLTYRQLKTLCHQVSRRLPHSALDPLMGPLPPGPPSPPDLTFRVTRGGGEYTGLVLYTHKTYSALQVVWLEGRRLLTLLNSFFSIAAPDLQQHALPAAAAAAGASGQNSAQQLGVAGASAGAGGALSAVDAAAAAAEVAAMLASYLQSFMQASDPPGTGPQQQQQQRRQQQQGDEEDEGSEGAGGPCCFLLVEILVGPHGAVNYMNTVHQQACINPGRKAATKDAAARQQEVLQLSSPAINEWLWLWLVCFVLQQDWHLHLAQSSSSVRVFLETAGCRCSWLAEQLQEQQHMHPTRQQQQDEEEWEERQQGHGEPALQQQQQQRGLLLRQQQWEDPDIMPGQEQQELLQRSVPARDRTTTAREHHNPAAGAAAAAGSQQQQRDPLRAPRQPSSEGDDDDDGEELLRQQQQRRQRQRQSGGQSSGGDFMSWLQDQDQQQQQQEGASRATFEDPGQAGGAAGQGATSGRNRSAQGSQQLAGQVGGLQWQPASARVGGGAAQPEGHAAAAGMSWGGRVTDPLGDWEGGAAAAGVIPDSEEEEDVIVLD